MKTNGFAINCYSNVCNLLVHFLEDGDELIQFNMKLCSFGPRVRITSYKKET